MQTESHEPVSLVRITAGVILAIGIFFVLIQLKSVLLPFVFAVLLTFLTYPLINKLMSWKIPKWLSIFLTLTILMISLVIFYRLIVSSSRGFIDQWGFYSLQISKWLDVLFGYFGTSYSEFVAIITPGSQTLDAGDLISSVFSSGLISGFVNSVTTILGDVFLILLFWLFMCSGKAAFELKLDKIFGGSDQRMMTLYKKITGQIQSYILIKTVISLITGLGTGIIVWLFGGDFAIFWGLLTFLLNFIPNIGSLIATILPVLFLMLKFGASWQAFVPAILLVVNQNVIGNYLEPVYLGRHMNLSTVFVLLSLLLWGWVWGLSGMFLAVPLSAIMVIIFENIDSMKPIAYILGGKKDPAA